MKNSTPTKLTFPELLHWINLIAKLPWDATGDPQAINHAVKEVQDNYPFRLETVISDSIDPFLCHDGIDVNRLSSTLAVVAHCTETGQDQEMAIDLFAEYVQKLRSTWPKPPLHQETGDRSYALWQGPHNCFVEIVHPHGWPPLLVVCPQSTRLEHGGITLNEFIGDYIFSRVFPLRDLGIIKTAIPSKAFQKDGKDYTLRQGDALTWDAFEEQLAITVSKLPRRSFLIIADSQSPDYLPFVQFCVHNDLSLDYAVTAEFTGEDIGIRKASFTTEQRQTLNGLGFAYNDPAIPNWERYCRWPLHSKAITDIAHACVIRLRDIGTVKTPSQLRYWGWVTPEDPNPYTPDGQLDPGTDRLMPYYLGLEYEALD